MLVSLSVMRDQEACQVVLDPNSWMQSLLRPSTCFFPARMESAWRCRCRRTALRNAPAMSRLWRAARRIDKPMPACNTRRGRQLAWARRTGKSLSGNPRYPAPTPRKPTGLSTAVLCPPAPAATQKRRSALALGARARVSSASPKFSRPPLMPRDILRRSSFGDGGEMGPLLLSGKGKPAAFQVQRYGQVSYSTKRPRKPDALYGLSRLNCRTAIS